MAGIGTLKNDKERIAFLEDFRNLENGWYLWKDLDDIGRRWWRYDLEDSALIVEEELRTLTYPEKRTKWIVRSWYIIRDWHLPFADGSASRTMALAEIKMETRREK